MPNKPLQWMSVREEFREAVLRALDETAAHVFRAREAQGKEGASDADLPTLFKAIDAHTRRLAARYNYPLED